MKYNQFSITEIALTNDQAIQLKIDCINAIENYGIENFENKRREIEIKEYEDNDPIKCAIICETFSEFDEQAAPFEPTIIDRSVHLSIKLFNNEGSPVKWTVEDEKEYDKEKDRWFYNKGIDIEEEVEKHFTI